MRRATSVLTLALALALALGLSAAPAPAFDTGPHSDISRDALNAEGFGRTAADVANVNNWFVDLYSNAKSVPHSGHSSFFKELLGEAFGSREHWSQDVVDAAVFSHFDSELPYLSSVQGAQREWDRLNRATGRLARRARDQRNPLALLTVIGMSLHQLEDFYSHSNWIEPQGVTGVDGPDWARLPFGGTPTWYDVAQESRDGLNVYVGGTTGRTRKHGAWNWDRNRSLKTGIAKDWPGRPGYADAHIASYFAARQWVRGLRAWVGDDAFWAAAQRFSHRYGGELDHDLRGATWIGMFSGHWQGQGEPCNPEFSTTPCGDRNGDGGDLFALRSENESYFEDRGRTHFRKLFERWIVPLAARAPTGDVFPLSSSQGLQRTTRFVRLQVLKMRGIDLGDIGPDDADMYARATIGGQRFLSGEINGHDSYAFPRPNAPFAFLKALPIAGTFAAPVTSLRVEVRTSSARYAGTDDDVFLTIAPGLRFPLDKRLYDDFERGDRDTYSVPIDDAVRAGLTVGDLQRIQIDKSRDGVAGGWKLRGVKVIANGRVVYAREGIERWLEDDHRVWQAPDFVRSAPMGAAVPVTLDLFDDDPLIYGSDDHGDLEPFDRRRTLALGYVPGPLLERRTTGGSTLGGRLGDSDKATVLYRLDTLTPTATPPPLVTPPVVVTPPIVVDPPPPPAKPDLVISDMGWNAMNQYFFTVKNTGAAAAGAFTVDVPGYKAFAFGGLAAGASITQSYTSTCVVGAREARADSLLQVAETDETNNTRSYTQDICLA